MALVSVGLVWKHFADSGYSYARITARLLYKGRPVTMDWVVTCQSIGLSGDMKGYVRIEVDPYFYGVATDDGGMVIAVAPAYCGHAPPMTNYLPVFLTGEKAGDFSSLTAYLAEEAFSSPSSQLSVLGVTLSPVSDEERRDLLKHGMPNVVPASPNPFLDENQGWPLLDFNRKVNCLAYERIPISPDLQPAVDAAWPAQQPQFWRPPPGLGDRLVDDFYHKAPNTSKLFHAAESASIGYGAIRRPNKPVGAKVYIDRPPNEHALVFEPDAFKISPAEFSIWKEDARFAKLERSPSGGLITVDGVITLKSDDIGMAKCGRDPASPAPYRVDTQYRLDSGPMIKGNGTFSTQLFFMGGNHTLYSLVRFRASAERSFR